MKGYFLFITYKLISTGHCLSYSNDNKIALNVLVGTYCYHPSL